MTEKMQNIAAETQKKCTGICFCKIFFVTLQVSFPKGTDK